MLSLDKDMIAIDLATTEELITELLSRATFAGVVVYSPDNHRFQGQNHRNFKVMSTCENDSTVRLLQQTLAGFNTIQGEK